MKQRMAFAESPRKPTNCGAEGDRTPDLFHAMEALSQLSYSPVRKKRVRIWDLVISAVNSACL